MQRPTKSEYNYSNDTVKLWFDRGTAVYQIRGAIQWPIGRNPGYALLSGQSTQTQVIWIFQEYPFWTISTVRTQAGLWKFLEEMSQKYQCDHYFYTEMKESERFLMQVFEEPLVTKKPTFIDVEYDPKDERLTDSLIYEYSGRGKLKVDKQIRFRQHDHERSFELIRKEVEDRLEEHKKLPDDGIKTGNLYEQLLVFKGGYVTDQNILPGVKALTILLSGYEKYPYRKPTEIEEKIPRSYYR